MRKDIAFMKELGNKNIIAEIKNSVKSWNIDDTSQKIERKAETLNSREKRK